MSILKNLTRLLLSGAVLFCLWGCSGFTPGGAEYCDAEPLHLVTEARKLYSIPLAGDSSFVYWGSDSHLKSAKNCVDQSFIYQYSELNFCIRNNGRDSNCITNLRVNSSDYLLSTYEDGVFLLNPINIQLGSIFKLDWEVTLWNWKTGVKSIDTISNKLTNLLLFQSSNGLYQMKGQLLKNRYGKPEGLYSVAKTDSGFFLRLSESIDELDHKNLSVNMMSKFIDFASRDSTDPLTQKKCQLGYWSRKGKKYCIHYDENTFRGGIDINDSLKIRCDHLSESVFLRFFNMATDEIDWVLLNTYLRTSSSDQLSDQLLTPFIFQSNCEVL
jgi:hypothetical protein